MNEIYYMHAAVLRSIMFTMFIDIKQTYYSLFGLYNFLFKYKIIVIFHHQKAKKSFIDVLPGNGVKKSIRKHRERTK